MRYFIESITINKDTCPNKHKSEDSSCLRLHLRRWMKSTFVSHDIKVHSNTAPWWWSGHTYCKIGGLFVFRLKENVWAILKFQKVLKKEQLIQQHLNPSASTEWWDSLLCVFRWGLSLPPSCITLCATAAVWAAWTGDPSSSSSLWKQGSKSKIHSSHTHRQFSCFIYLLYLFFLALGTWGTRFMNLQMQVDTGTEHIIQ